MKESRQNSVADPLAQVRPDLRTPVNQILGYMQANGTQPDGLEKLLRRVRRRHGDGPLDEDFSIVRIRF